MTRKNLTIGLFGFGCVGNGLYEVLQKTPGLKTTIKNICVKDRHKKRQLPASHFTYNKFDILDDPEINVVVELIDDADAAFEIVSEALKRGKAVVSANKKMIAENFHALLQLQQTYNVPLLYEAACCASIPIIRNLEEYYDTDLLTSVEGVVNGSCNYILSKVFGENQSYNTALQTAQRLGYAESNPSLDTGGHDSKYKLQLLIAHAFGLVIKPEQIFTVGIENLGDLELQFAREKGCKIKLVAQAVKHSDNAISFFVLPKFIAPDNKFFTVDDVYNGVQTHTSFSETQFFVGKGAGAYPTASAVLSDLSALTYGYKYEYKKLQQAKLPAVGNNLRLKVFFRTNSLSPDSYRGYFEEVQEVYNKGRYGYVIGVLTLESLRELARLSNEDFSVVLLHETEPIEEADLAEEPAEELVQLRVNGC